MAILVGSLSSDFVKASGGDTIFYRLFTSKKSDGDYFSIAVPAKATLHDLLGDNLSSNLLLYHRDAENQPKYVYKPNLFFTVKSDVPLKNILVDPGEFTEKEIMEEIARELTDEEGSTRMEELEEMEGPSFPPFRYVLLPEKEQFFLYTVREYQAYQTSTNGFIAKEELGRNKAILAKTVGQDNSLQLSWVKGAGGLTVIGVGSYLLFRFLQKPNANEDKDAEGLHTKEQDDESSR